MQIIVRASQELKAELMSNVENPAAEIIWIERAEQFREYPGADAFIDLLFEKDQPAVLQELLPALIIINSVVHTLAEIHPSFVRINGWPTFLRSALVEASALQEDRKQVAEAVFSVFNKNIQWLPDEAGFVTPRVISTIINEAFISLNEGVSTREEIDTAMKLGTNYPFGPFEWAQKIGTKNINTLLEKLAREKERYTSFIG